MVAAGAASLVAEGDEFVKRLGTAFEELNDRPRLLRMAIAARGQAKPDAARRIAEICLEAGA
jgi:UDP-N-acetylglucosamine--N-acetylmuramyl-(pentapeptide) pyrophosphoryl-undecaprenol N-acetylglucosamine transferase